jgi:hypothetical protein
MEKRGIACSFHFENTVISVIFYHHTYCLFVCVCDGVKRHFQQYFLVGLYLNEPREWLIMGAVVDVNAW